MRHMETVSREQDISDAVDRLLSPNRPSFRRPPDPSVLKALAETEEAAAPVVPKEFRVETDAAMSRIVLVVPRHGGPDASALRDAIETRPEEAASSARAAAPPAITAIDGARWTVRAGPKGADCEALVEVLAWDDLADAAMPTAIRHGLRATARTVWTYLSTGALVRLWHLRRGAVMAAGSRLLPFAAEVVLALGVGLVSGRLLAGGLAPLLSSVDLPNWPGVLVASFAGASAAFLVLRNLRRNDGRIGAYAPMRGLAYLSSGRGAYPPALEERIVSFSERIGWALRQRVREVVVVGQGDGAALAVSALVEAVQWGELPDGAPAVSILTLGQSIPLIGFLPEAGRLRADLRDLSLRRDICWLDVSDPADLHAFALCDPVAVCGVAQDDRKGPLVLASSCGRFRGRDALSVWRQNGLRLRDRYLEPMGDEGRDYDWMRVILGRLPMRKFLGGRPPASGRIDIRGSAYINMSRPPPEPEDD